MGDSKEKVCYKLCVYKSDNTWEIIDFFISKTVDEDKCLFLASKKLTKVFKTPLALLTLIFFKLSDNKYRPVAIAYEIYRILDGKSNRDGLMLEPFEFNKVAKNLESNTLNKVLKKVVNDLHNNIKIRNLEYLVVGAENEVKTAE